MPLYNIISRRSTPVIVLSSKSKDERRARLDDKIEGKNCLLFSGNHSFLVLHPLCSHSV